MVRIAPSVCAKSDQRLNTIVPGSAEAFALSFVGLAVASAVGAAAPLLFDRDSPQPAWAIANAPMTTTSTNLSARDFSGARGDGDDWAERAVRVRIRDLLVRAVGVR